MLTIEECRRILNDPSASDEEIARLKDELYRFVDRFLDDYLNKTENHKKPTIPVHQQYEH